MDLIIQYSFHKTLIFLKIYYFFFYFTASYCRGAGHDNLICIKRQSVAPTFPHTPLMTRLFYHLTVIGLGEGRCVVFQILSLKHQCKTKEFLTDSTKLYIAKTYFINSLFETQISSIKQKKKDEKVTKDTLLRLKYTGPYDKLSLFLRTLRLYIPLYKSEILTDTG